MNIRVYVQDQLGNILNEYIHDAPLIPVVGDYARVYLESGERDMEIIRRVWDSDSLLLMVEPSEEGKR